MIYNPPQCHRHRSREKETFSAFLRILKQLLAPHLCLKQLWPPCSLSWERLFLLHPSFPPEKPCHMVSVVPLRSHCINHMPWCGITTTGMGRNSSYGSSNSEVKQIHPSFPRLLENFLGFIEEEKTVKLKIMTEVSIRCYLSSIAPCISFQCES